VKLVADVHWSFHRAWQILQRELLTPARELPTETSALVSGVTIERDVPVTMSDGVRLFADVYLPEGTGPRVLLGQRAIAGETILAELGATPSLTGRSQ
jgi:predicted acyl esterase